MNTMTMIRHVLFGVPLAVLLGSANAHAQKPPPAAPRDTVAASGAQAARQPKRYDFTPRAARQGMTKDANGDPAARELNLLRYALPRGAAGAAAIRVDSALVVPRAPVRPPKG